MATNFKDYIAECPFYKTLNNTSIVCEGFVKKTSTAMMFSNNSHQMEWLENVCGKNYELCPMYRMILKEKYKRGA